MKVTGAFSQSHAKKSRNVGKLFSELKLVTDNLLSIYATASWEATERFYHAKKVLYSKTVVDISLLQVPLNMW